MKSMTGYGFVQKNHDPFQLSIEIKTLNSKNFDCKINLPDKLEPYEINIREVLREAFHRGKIQVNFNVEFNEADYEKKSLNKDLFRAYYEELNEMVQELNLHDADLLRVVFGFRDIYREPEVTITDEHWQILQKDLAEAVQECDQRRAEEGQKLKEALEDYGRKIEEYYREIDGQKQGRLDHIRSKLEKSINELREKGFEVSPERLEQEMIYYAEKLDISEELVRLKTHMDYYNQLLEEEAPGRSLHFICQELNREINTIGAKANDSDIQHKVVKMKEEVEKIREQIQNVV